MEARGGARWSRFQTPSFQHTRNAAKRTHAHVHAVFALCFKQAHADAIAQTLRSILGNTRGSILHVWGHAAAR
eukprot:250502-Chlamydomonas_euryale.AAC.29